MSTLKKRDLAENSNTGLMNSMVTSVFMIRSLPLDLPIMAWHSILSFTCLGLMMKQEVRKKLRQCNTKQGAIIIIINFCRYLQSSVKCLKCLYQKMYNPNKIEIYILKQLVHLFSDITHIYSTLCSIDMFPMIQDLKRMGCGPVIVE